MRGLLGPSAPPPPARQLGARPVRPSGPRVQIGIFGSRAIAVERWAELRRRYPKDMAARSLIVEPQTLRGRSGFRSSIRGFRSKNEALSLCVRLRREGWDCIVRL